MMLTSMGTRLDKKYVENYTISYSLIANEWQFSVSRHITYLVLPGILLSFLLTEWLNIESF